ncbi:hypothetical protein [Gordonia rhizosphera]|uniref:Integral membrane protein n=1 Tax=Gordonia rhizosphera NBRC 16068 TaxID=1108045 RepID=K6WPU2_9ACTN|nr:hypothetical protein [Gordonia rhizosphera]GAB88564.1 hypothetical protein GORHZ_028_00280 [Gordonia rhizosphera NBRC 16068]
MAGGDSRRPPATIRAAGAVTALEGAIAVVVAVILAIREASGHREAAISGYGTAAWFGIIGGGVLLGGIALLAGRRWGRAIAVVAQILLLPVAYALLTDSHQPWFGVPLGIAAIGVLVAMFSPASTHWLAGEYGSDDPADGGSRARR